MTGNEVDRRRGEVDGTRDGAAGVKPLGQKVFDMFYSRSYQEGYRKGYDRAMGRTEATA